MKPIGTPERIIELTAEAYDITYEEITGNGRLEKYTFPRYAAIHLVKRYFDSYSYLYIAKMFNKKDHTLVSYALKKYNDLIFNGSLDKDVVDYILKVFEKETRRDEFKKTYTQKRQKEQKHYERYNKYSEESEFRDATLLCKLYNERNNRGTKKHESLLSENKESMQSTTEGVGQVYQFIIEPR